MTGAASKDDRLAVRMTARQKQDIERAAVVLGRTVTDFSVQTLTERAEEVLADRRLFDLSQEEWDEFLRQLEQPARPVAELVALLRRRSVFEE
ncbi:MAG: type II toxin-antitoxin system TacA family antitoxin [Nocardioidaceae bacterium]